MPRFFHFGGLLGLAALSAIFLLTFSPMTTAVAQTSGRASGEMAVPAIAQTRSESPAPKVAHVEQVSVHAGDAADAGLIVEIQTSGRVAPDTQVITDPDRIIVDFPGALPAAALHALKVNQGALTGVRTGLFFNNPPITRVVLDLAEPQSYQISTTGTGVVLKLSPAKANSAKTNAGTPNPAAPNSNSPSPTAQNSGAPNSAGPNSSTINPVNSNSVKLNRAQSSLAKSRSANSSPADSSPVQSNAVKSNPAMLKSVKSTAAGSAKLNSAKLSLDLGAGVVIERYPITPGARTPMTAPAITAIVATAPKPVDASPARSIGPVGPSVTTANIPTVNAATVNLPTVNVATVSIPREISEAAAAPTLEPIAEEAAPPKPAMSVTFANGMLSIRTEKATLAQVLYEVQRQTQAEIAIPAGAEQEEVAANLGPASARDVLASLLNGSPYNFIFIGSQERLERVILTVRDPNIF